jgi:Protein of unknown function (DUF1640)
VATAVAQEFLKLCVNNAIVVYPRQEADSTLVEKFGSVRNMTTLTFDTLKFTRKLESGGFTREQSTVIAEAVAEVQTESVGDLATKSDLEKLELRFKTEMAAIRGELTLLKWMLGTLLAGVASLVVRAFW